MAEDFIPHTFNDSLIHQRIGDGYINLNQMADATGKRIDNWLRLQETKELIAEFDKQQVIASSDLRKRSKALITVMGGAGGGGSTWAHPDIAIQFAQKCSPPFALQVSRWVREWMTTARNPLVDIDRVGLRDELKDDSRIRMTDQVKNYLEQIKRYDDTKYRGMYFAKVHDAINKAITTETAREMRDRISIIVGKKVKDTDLIRDYFPTTFLSKYISLCETTANLMLKKDRQPLVAVEEAAELVLPASYVPTPIDFVEHIKNVRLRISQDRNRGELPE
jgi:hypothetical protein